MSILFDRIFSVDSMLAAYRKALLGPEKYKKEALLFQQDETANLLELHRELYDKTYQFSGYTSFTVYEPKERIINAPHFRDKIVQLALNTELSKIFVPSFIPETYSCIKGRGVHAAVNKVQSNIQRAKCEWGESTYIFKLDVRKFFYSINRSILKTLYRRKIKDDDVLWVLDTITDSADAIAPRGLPLGNTMSQLYSNIYLDRLDQACKRYWGYYYYVRYADDVIIVLPDKSSAKLAKDRCTAFLREQLDLQVNTAKTQIFPVKNGVNTMGYKIRPTHRLLRDRTKQKLKRKIKAFPGLIAAGKMTADKVDEILASWQGHAKHADSYHFCEYLTGRFKYIYKDGKGRLRIQRQEVNTDDARR